MKTKKTIVYTADQVDSIARTLKELMSVCQIFTFTGPIGVGKTTLIRAILRKCGVNDTISSPTFTYLNVYKNDSKSTFYHFDLYRIRTLDEFIDAGFNEYLYQPNSWTFIEWPSPVMSLVRHKLCAVDIDYNGQEDRKLTYILHKD